jgi:group I intron endonuclease
MLGHIYKITNDINDKIYIGCCSTTIEERFSSHIKDFQKRYFEKRPLYSAMQKYGVEHFHIEEIESCDISIMFEREIYWIQYFDSYGNGYNATKGGDGKLLYDHEAICKRLKEHPYPIDVAKEFGCCPDTVKDLAKRYCIEVQNKGQKNFIEKSKTVVALDKKTLEEINVFNSTSDAAKWCFENQYTSALSSGVRGHIAEAANGKRKSAYGFIWKYKDN